MTSAARSRIRWSAADTGSAACRTSVPSVSAPAATAVTHRSPRCTVRPGRPAVAASATFASSRPADGADGDQRPAVRVEDDERAAEDVDHHRGDVLHPAAADDERGHAVVGLRRPLHRRGARLDELVRGAQLLERGPRLLQQAGVVERHRRVRGERPEQRHLLLRERPGAAVGREQDADHARAEPHRDAEDRDQPFLAHRGVDVAVVVEALVVEVVGAVVRRAGHGHQAAEPGAHRQPQRPERARRSTRR